MKTSTPALFLAMLALSHAQTPIDLAGDWRLALDPADRQSQTSPEEWTFPESIRLPGLLTAQGFGETPNFKTTWTGDGWRYPELFKEWQSDANFKFPFFLQPPKVYVGPACYQREFDWPGGPALIHLERVHWQSTVWLDGKKIGQGDSLGTPHEFELGELPAGKHVLTLRINNRLSPVNVGPLSHSVTDHTQGNWNGVVGKIEVRKVHQCRVTNLQVFPKMDGTVKVVVEGLVAPDTREAGVRLELSPKGSPGPSVSLPWQVVTMEAGGRFRAERAAEVENARPWNEFSPALYEARAYLSWGDDTEDVRKATFGFREPGSRNGRVTLNGRPIFLRGTLECAIFPLTGHPPTDVASWQRIIRICKAHGLNHIRFHSWCPPEAAFIAADELGFYYQVEASSWANMGTEIGSGNPLDDWLEKESKRILAAYGNHPSFLLMAYGNEPAGKQHKDWLREWVARRKGEDPRRLYTTGAGWPVLTGSDYHSSPDPRIQRWGEGAKSLINDQAPRTDFDWSGFVAKHPDAPIISHEIGQWCVYPNFGEIAKYTGYFKARNFEIFQETARRNGLLPQTKDFLMASGKLQVLAYKHDIEAALRTPGFGGFQLLDLHDFPGQGTALVGVLDAFWEEKGYVTPEEYRRFAGPIVPLARMKKLVYQTGDTMEAELELAQFGPEDLKQAKPFWKLAGIDGTLVAKGELPPRDLATGDLHELGAIRVPLDPVKHATKLVLSVGIAGTDALNHWDVFVFPKAPDADTPAVAWTTSLDDTRKLLARGEKVFWLPGSKNVRDDAARPLVAGFSPIFWNTAWTKWQPPHTLGVLCQPEHPALAGFPTDFHSNWQWWEIQQGARPFILTKHHNLIPIVQDIDDWFTNRKLGYVFEAKVGPGKLLACAPDLDQAVAGRQAAAELMRSLVRYIHSDQFAPKVEMRPEDLDELVVGPGKASSP